jgi:phosphatidylserine decarboxylase
MGWLSSIESPALTRVLIRIWLLFSRDLDLTEAQASEFSSLQACFTRKLRPGARAIDQREGILVSPCDGIVGEHGDIDGTKVFQAKGFPYYLEDLIPDHDLRETYRDGKYITLRLTSSMYHRFHAPMQCIASQVIYISGDTWNVNPIALKRVEKLYCKNERAVLSLSTADPSSSICLVAVAAILVASVKFTWLDNPLDIRYKGPKKIACSAAFEKGEELGYFQHGSTIILFATTDFEFVDGLKTGETIQMGRPLLAMHVHESEVSNRNEPQKVNEVTA